MPELVMIGCQNAIHVAQLLQQRGSLAEEVEPIGVDHNVGLCREGSDELGEEDRHVATSAQSRTYHPGVYLLELCLDFAHPNLSHFPQLPLLSIRVGLLIAVEHRMHYQLGRVGLNRYRGLPGAEDMGQISTHPDCSHGGVVGRTRVLQTAADHPHYPRASLDCLKGELRQNFSQLLQSYHVYNQLQAKGAILIVIFMLPKINDRQPARETIDYHSYARQIMRRKASENDISKLKMLKQFLEEEQYDTLKQRNPNREAVYSSCKFRQSLEQNRTNSLKPKQKKQCQLFKQKSKRKSLTAEASAPAHKQNSFLFYKQKSIFVPDRIKLNDLITEGRKDRRVAIKDSVFNSVKLNNQLNTHRIL